VNRVITLVAVPGKARDGKNTVMTSNINNTMNNTSPCTNKSVRDVSTSNHRYVDITLFRKPTIRNSSPNPSISPINEPMAVRKTRMKAQTKKKIRNNIEKAIPWTKYLATSFQFKSSTYSSLTRIFCSQVA
jgi:hypothetical protein